MVADRVVAWWFADEVSARVLAECNDSGRKFEVVINNGFVTPPIKCFLGEVLGML